MSEILLVPIHANAMYVSSEGAFIVSPAADFTQIPYQTFIKKRVGRGPHARTIEELMFFNSDTPFTSEHILREDTNLDQYNSANYKKLSKGIHLHWSLPDALTFMRADPKSNNLMRFPQVPNRWLITCKSEISGSWKVKEEWVVESDYLYPEEASGAGVKQRDAVTFPIVPPDTYMKILKETPPSRDDAEKNPEYSPVYNAPFRYMGRCQKLSDWRNNVSEPENCLSHYMPQGLTAIGYGDPLFAAIYSNCFSVFGFNDGNADNSTTLRYEILGWYDNIENDCLQLYEALKSGTNLFEALKAEYKWKIINQSGGFPKLSVYYSIVDVQANLQKNPAISNAKSGTSSPPEYSDLTVAIGNSGLEALSADLSHTLANGDKAIRPIIEDQIEAIGLRSELAGLTTDIGPRFQDVRHANGFKPEHGGTIWSVRERGVSKSAAQQKNRISDEEVTLPDDLAHLLNEVNLAQATYDQAWQKIDTLRHEVFADWCKFENAYNYGSTNTTVIYTNPLDVPGSSLNSENEPTYKNLINEKIDPSNFIGDEDEIIPYVSKGNLQELQQQLAWAGNIEVDKEASGKYKLTATNASNNPYVQDRYTLAHQVIAKLNQLISIIEEYNIKPAMTQAKKQYILLQKSAPRFWEPNDPVVLLKGDAVPTTPRHGEDGRANDDNTLTCHVLSAPSTAVEHGLSGELQKEDPDSVIQNIWSTIKGLRPEIITVDSIGFSVQKEQPWNPISLEWEVGLWQETEGMNSTIAWYPKSSYTKNAEAGGGAYASDFITNNYRFDVDAPDLKMNHVPGQFTDSNETENIYTGRTTLTPGAGKQLIYNIETYLMGLTLFDLKLIILNDHTISDEQDYKLDNSLIKWAGKYFTLINTPSLTDPASITGKEKDLEIAAQKNEVDQWYRTNHIFRVKVNSPNEHSIKYKLVDLTNKTDFPDGWYDDKPVFILADKALKLETFGDLKTESERVQDPVYTAINAYTKLSAMQVLAQSLGGFNNALLMRKQTLQLPVFDITAMNTAIQPAGAYVPASEDKYKNFARNIATAVANGNRSVPVITTDFLPIRSGVMKITKLYLVDTFGQVINTTPANITTSEAMTISPNLVNSTKVTSQQDAGYAYMGPRLAQAARLDFRWLAADSPDEIEMNDHPASTPVCGWVIPNNLNQSLMVYDTAGVPLGSIQATGQWEPAPGTVNSILLDNIPNPHLRRWATYLTNFSGKNKGYLPDFLNAVNYALENIEPENFAQHEATALLIGRPMALVRTSLNLRLKGRPALNQSWWAFLYDMYHNYLDNRVDNNFSNVTFPIRLGEYRQLNDGLVGYWIEDGDSYKDNIFYSSQSEDVNNAYIVTHHDVAISTQQTLVSDPLKLTMLVDPRGVVHATSGILPAKQIDIPPDQYARILKKLSVTFLTTPILTDIQGIRLDLPRESGYSWSWLTHPNASVWEQTDRIQATDSILKFTPQRLVEGWLKLTPDDET